MGSNIFANHEPSLWSNYDQNYRVIILCYLRCREVKELLSNSNKLTLCLGLIIIKYNVELLRIIKLLLRVVIQSTTVFTSTIRYLFGLPPRLKFILLNTANIKMGKAQSLTSDLLCSKLQILLQKLKSVSEQSFQTICQVYKYTCQKLIYFLKRHLNSALPTTACAALVTECLIILKKIIASTELEKYGHWFSIYQLVISHYEKIFAPLSSRCGSQGVLIRLENNCQSPYYKKSRDNPIQITQINFLNSSHLMSFFQELSQGYLMNQNFQCICCTQVFIKNGKVLNANPLIPVVLQLTENKGFNPVYLEKCFNALCNSGGGVVIIGAEMKNEDWKIEGIRFKTMEDFLEKHKLIQSALVNLKPSFNYLIQKVHVHTSHTEPKNIWEQNMRVCFRVVIFPCSPRKLTYLEFSHKGHHTVHEAFRLNRNKSPEKIKFINLNDKIESLYTIAHKKYFTAAETVNSHKNINCFRPHNEYSNLFKKYIQQGNPIDGHTTEELRNQSETKHSQNDDSPKFKYQNSSLFIAGPQKNDRIVQDFAKSLEKKKMPVQLSRPYPNSFKQISRSIWLLSHQMNYIELKQELDRFQCKSSVIKPGSIRSMPVCLNLEVDRAKYTQSVDKYMTKKFQSRFHTNFSKQSMSVDDPQSGELKQIMYLCFSNYMESIYAYLILEELRIKPYFTKVSSAAYKKKQHSKQ